jgi:hypothetical protein
MGITTITARFKTSVAMTISITMSVGCIDKVDFPAPAPGSLTIIEGMISDQIPPYSVKVSRALPIDSDSTYHGPVRNATIFLFDDQGNSESLHEIEPGTYKTGGQIHGMIGHAYKITVTTDDGVLFESDYDTVRASGQIDSIRYQYQAKTATQSFGTVQADFFNIFVDAHAAPEAGPYTRWRFTGTYKAVSNPELHSILLQGSTWLKDPRLCSGYVVEPGFGGGILVQKNECTCCTCWAHHFETKPQLSDVFLVQNGTFNNIKVAEVPINPATFYEKYQVFIEQMSLSRAAFGFFKAIRNQKEGASSLFQPQSGEIPGNISTRNSASKVAGIFWATSIHEKKIYITREEVPYNLPPIYFVPDACTSYYPNSSTQKPAEWE